MASGAEEEGRARREAGEEDTDEDDERPQLSAAAAGALREFLEEQGRHEGEKGGGEGVELVAEDWRLSQFWYDERTARELSEEVARLASGLPAGASTSAAVACVACPTLYAYLRKSSPDVPARLLEYDERFGQYGDDFAFYDYNQPEALPPAMKHAFQIVVADPPYLSQECLEKVAKTVSFLAQPEGSFLLLLTGEVQKDRALELLNVRPCGFKPQHSNKLGNVFRLFTNYDPVDRLGGWDRSDGAPV
ncbi:EEF1A lysine methyltransferase 1-like [Hordeum vulgare subsp. vulgare]|uniref:Protein-lysine N-methyltransferase LOC123452243 n=1 Tax=Hordeum vulgare subsp. vulgare TaxID=112509 RepID=A0A8I6YV94_HORVV|nr:EEF1A lysine methyltransferase 1-like [Hordeum vulgare subsp. vulgare]